MITAKQTRTAI